MFQIKTMEIGRQIIVNIIWNVNDYSQMGDLRAFSMELNKAQVSTIIHLKIYVQ